MGTHLLVANRGGGWGYLCAERPENWQTMEGHPTDDPLIIPTIDHPTCEVCSMLITKNRTETYLVKSNWPVSWVPIK
jgi:hypothetical protein